MSLRVKLALFFTLTVSMLLAVFCTVVFSIVKNQQLRAAEDLLKDHMEHEWSHLIARHGHPDGGPDTFPDPEIWIQVTKNGKIVSGRLPVAEPGGELFIERHWARVFHDDRFELAGRLSPRRVTQYLATLRNILMLGCLLAVLFIAPISWAFTGTLLKPFRELSRKTSELDAKQLSFRFPGPEHRDEYGTLVTSFNALLDRLQGSFGQIRRFATNASHELKTPITVIRGEAELMLRKHRDIIDYEQSLERILGQSKKLQSVVLRLLTLADIERMESRHAERSLIPVKRAVNEAVEILQRVHPAPAKTVTIEGDEFQYVGQAEIFGSVVNNLVENAIKFSRETVRVRFHKDLRGVHLRVEDDGKGVTDEEKGEIFEPFYKGAEGRAGEGHGLGLAIVKACVDAAKGKISLCDSTMGGLCIDVFLPESQA